MIEMSSTRRKAQAVAVAGLVVCCLLVFVLTGPKIMSDITSDTPADAVATTAATKGAASTEASTQDAAADTGSGSSGGQVQVGFFGESLCPDCQHMIRDVLAPMFENGVATLMDLKYHAFGNVKNNSDGSFSYQHGADEGKYNRYILCAQHFHKKQEEWFPYVKCLADNMRNLKAKADSCASEHGWEAAQISGCADGDEGKGLEKQAAEATWALRPKHNFVPWITVNGVAIGNAFEQLERFVCAASPAKTLPDACYSLPDSMAHQHGR